MDIYSRYKKIKDKIGSICPTFYFTGQYLEGKGKVGYAVPAIYIEMPKALKIDYFPGKLQVAKEAQVKIHLLSNAPYSTADNTIQDTALQNHQAKLKQIHDLLSGTQFKDNNNKLIMSQFILVADSGLNYNESFAYQVLTYQSEFYHKEY